MERHATKVTSINRTSKDKGVAFTGISHNRFVLPTPRAHTPECFFPIEVVSSLNPIQSMRHLQKEWILNMQICSKLVSHKIAPIVTDCQHSSILNTQALIDRVGMIILDP